MLRNQTNAVVFSTAILLGSLGLPSLPVMAADLPTINQVYEAAHAGRMDDAQKMLQQVLAAHPNSSKAHYVEAELLAKQGKLDAAKQEFNTAEKLDPGLGYAKPEAVQELKARIFPASISQPAVSPTQRSSSGFPWGLLVLGIGSIFLITWIIRAFSARNNPVVYPNGYQTPGQPYNNGPYGQAPYAQPTAGSGMGSGIMGGLATGAAIGAGMVAGEALADHFIHGNNSNSGINPVSDSWADSNINPNDNMGGNDFGIADNSSWDDNSSDISGGDDWT